MVSLCILASPKGTYIVYVSIGEFIHHFTYFSGQDSRREGGGENGRLAIALLTCQQLEFTRKLDACVYI